MSSGSPAWPDWMQRAVVPVGTASETDWRTNAFTTQGLTRPIWSTYADGATRTDG
jgi:hypothetical protein